MCFHRNVFRDFFKEWHNIENVCFGEVLCFDFPITILHKEQVHSKGAAMLCHYASKTITDHSLQEKDVMGKQWDDTYVRCSFLLNFTQWVFKTKKKNHNITYQQMSAWISRSSSSSISKAWGDVPEWQTCCGGGSVEFGCSGPRTQSAWWTVVLLPRLQGKESNIERQGQGRVRAQRAVHHSAGANFRVRATNMLAHEGTSSTKTWCRFTRICLSINKPAHQTALQRARSSSLKLHHTEH